MFLLDVFEDGGSHNVITLAVVAAIISAATTTIRLALTNPLLEALSLSKETYNQLQNNAILGSTIHKVLQVGN